MPDASAGAAAGAGAWRVTVDRSACIGSGICAALAPDFFHLEDERSRPLRAATGPDEALLDAADSCPAAAITVTEGTEVIGPRP
ncbi:ferredoxin [Streptomyces sp. URMC 127]|uniref:ferredoxin n=1 Tax=Streptomyces sp. URMC 127 TaxID=3423402 RepID=UPI003F1C4D92